MRDGFKHTVLRNACMAMINMSLPTGHVEELRKFCLG